MINVSINRKSVPGVPQPNANSMSSANYKDVAFLLHCGDARKHVAPNYIYGFLKRFFPKLLAHPLEDNFPLKKKKCSP